MKLVIKIENSLIVGAYADGPVDLTIVETDSNVDGGKPEITSPALESLGKLEMPAWFCNHYKCGRCGHEWEDEWSASCDDDCPSCGARHWSPTRSDNLTPSIAPLRPSSRTKSRQAARNRSRSMSRRSIKC